jgi:hypothetical protein
MPIRIGNDCTTAPLRIFGRGKNRSREIPKRPQGRIYRRHPKTDAGPESGRAVRSGWVNIGFGQVFTKETSHHLTPPLGIGLVKRLWMLNFEQVVKPGAIPMR